MQLHQVIVYYFYFVESGTRLHAIRFEDRTIKHGTKINLDGCLFMLVGAKLMELKDLVIDINPRTARWVIFILNACIPIIFYVTTFLKSFGLYGILCFSLIIP